ncbi:MAG: hypothetical protein EXS64_07725 [Candidatus Latescibacteria bacterium]|nr:hypothetical protein [Candidatus Latescibacterota bacterium]
MTWLILSILLSVLFGHTVRRAQARRCNMMVVGVVNYTVAALVCALLTALSGNLNVHGATLSLGALHGIGYILAYVAMCAAMLRGGLAVPTTIMRLSVVLPVLASVFWWGEQPTQAQVAGIVATLAALVLLGGRGVSGASDLQVWMLTGFLFLTSGGASVVSKAFLVLHLPDAKTTYTAVLFGTAALGGSLSFLTHRFRPTREDMGAGTLVGVTNVVATGIQLVAIDRMPGVIAFPAMACGGVVATAVFCAIVWKERFTRRMLVGMGIAVVGLALVNMK